MKEERVAIDASLVRRLWLYVIKNKRLQSLN